MRLQNANQSTHEDKKCLELTNGARRRLCQLPAGAIPNESFPEDGATENTRRGEESKTQGEAKSTQSKVEVPLVGNGLHLAATGVKTTTTCMFYSPSSKTARKAPRFSVKLANNRLYPPGLEVYNPPSLPPSQKTNRICVVEPTGQNPSRPTSAPHARRACSGCA